MHGSPAGKSEDSLEFGQRRYGCAAGWMQMFSRHKDRERGEERRDSVYQRIRQDRQPDARTKSRQVVTADRSGGDQGASRLGPSGAQHRHRYQIGHNLIVPEIAAKMRLAGFPSRSPPALDLALTVCPAANRFADEGQEKMRRIIM